MTTPVISARSTGERAILANAGAYEEELARWNDERTPVVVVRAGGGRSETGRLEPGLLLPAKERIWSVSHLGDDRCRRAESLALGDAVRVQQPVSHVEGVAGDS